MYTLKIDDRENIDFELFDTECGRKQVSVQKKRLTIGDYAVYHGTLLLLCIERKTWDDLSASIKDNRLEEQIEAMVQLRAASNVEIILLIEGTKRKQHGHIDIEALEAMLDTIMFNNRIHVEHCRDGKHSAQRIFQLVDHFPVTDSRLQSVQAVQGGDAGERDLLDIPKERSVEQQALQCMCAIKGVSMNTARLLLKHFTVRSLMALGKEHISKLEVLTYDTGTQFGALRAKKLVAEVAKPLTLAKILEEINGVTKATSIKMLELPSLDVDVIANMNKTAKLKVGRKLAEKITTILEYACA